MLIDSNIIIYATLPEYDHLRTWIIRHNPVVSAVSYVEVLGYHKLTEIEKRYFEQFFKATQILPISQDVLEQAIKLRQLKKCR